MKKKIQRGMWLGFDRALSRNLLKQLIILAVVLVAALGLSYLMLSWSGADWKAFCERKDLNMWLLPIYLLIDSNALNTLYIEGHVHGWMLIASSLTFLFGAFVFNGIIIGIITNSIERRVNDHKEGHIHYLKSGHYVIMGYDDMVPSIIAHVFEKDKDAYVLILTSAEVVDIREKLLKSFSEKQMERVIINYGHRVSADAFHDIRLEAAEQVYVVGNHTKPAHDAINVECVDSICRYLENPKIKQRPSRITCVFKDLDTYAAFKTSEIFKEVGSLNIEFIPYNFFTGWAKQVFVKRKYKDFDNPGTEYDYPAVFGNGIKPDDEKYVHLVFVGTTNFAVAFAMEAAQVLHFPNADKAKTRITFIDKNADKEKDEFIIRNRHFFQVQSYRYYDLTNTEKHLKEKEGERNEYVEFDGDDRDFLDVEFEFIKGDIFSKAVQDTIGGWAAEHNEQQYLSIFLALADQRQNFVMGMNMPDAVYDNEVPLFIRQDRSDNFVTNLRNADHRAEEHKMLYYAVAKDGSAEPKMREARYANIYPFGMNETAYSADEHSLKRAKLINYLYNTADYTTNKFQPVVVLDAIPERQIEDEADEYWNELTVALKWSNLYNAYTIRTKLATLRAMRGLGIHDASKDYAPLTEEEVRQLAVVEHNRWNVEKLLMGYRKPRPEEDKYVHGGLAGKLKKNKDLFIHHDIRPYAQLDKILVLDEEFSRYIPWLMRMSDKD
ncbi:MAG: hypothetical protein IJ588_06520 [Prevotella sp.]|nr:hypothetical protein [Prevotella sp.]